MNAVGIKLIQRSLTFFRLFFSFQCLGCDTTSDWFYCQSPVGMSICARRDLKLFLAPSSCHKEGATI